MPRRRVLHSPEQNRSSRDCRREWNAAAAGAGTETCSALFEKGVQNNREGSSDHTVSMTKQNPVELARRRSQSAAPPANSSDQRILDIETQWNPTDVDGSEESTNMQLVRSEENPVTARTATSSGKNRRANKLPPDKKSDTKRDSNSETKKKSAKHKNSKQTPMPVDQPDERLDMTGWSGDYNLPK